MKRVDWTRSGIHTDFQTPKRTEASFHSCICSVLADKAAPCALHEIQPTGSSLSLQCCHRSARCSVACVSFRPSCALGIVLTSSSGDGQQAACWNACISVLPGNSYPKMKVFGVT